MPDPDGAMTPMTDAHIFIIREVETINPPPTSRPRSVHAICYLRPPHEEEFEVARTTDLFSDSPALRRQKLSVFRWMVQASASFHRQRLFDCINETVYRPGQSPAIARMTQSELNLLSTP